MKRQFIALAASILCLASCNSFLERTPKSTMAPENYFRDETDLQLFSNSFYNNLYFYCKWYYVHWYKSSNRVISEIK